MLPPGVIRGMGLRWWGEPPPRNHPGPAQATARLRRIDRSGTPVDGPGRVRRGHGRRDRGRRRGLQADVLPVLRVQGGRGRPVPGGHGGGHAHRAGRPPRGRASLRGAAAHGLGRHGGLRRWCRARRAGPAGGPADPSHARPARPLPGAPGAVARRPRGGDGPRWGSTRRRTSIRASPPGRRSSRSTPCCGGGATATAPTTRPPSPTAPSRSSPRRSTGPRRPEPEVSRPPCCRPPPALPPPYGCRRTPL